MVRPFSKNELYIFREQIRSYGLANFVNFISELNSIRKTTVTAVYARTTV